MRLAVRGGGDGVCGGGLGWRVWRVGEGLLWEGKGVLRGDCCFHCLYSLSLFTVLHYFHFLFSFAVLFSPFSFNHRHFSLFSLLFFFHCSLFFTVFLYCLFPSFLSPLLFLSPFPFIISFSNT